MKTANQEKRIMRGAVVYLTTDRHPSVVVSNEAQNIYSDYLIVVPMSSRQKRLDLKTHTIVNYHDSIILAESIKTVRKADVRSVAHILNKESMERVDKCLSTALDLKK